MKKLFLMGACLWALGSTPVVAQTTRSEVVVVRMVFNGTRLAMAVSRGEGKTEMTQFDVPSGQLKNAVPLAEAYQRIVAKLTSEGYTLKGMNGDDAYATLVFVKGQ